jgi:hypothetical protein
VKPSHVPVLWVLMVALLLAGCSGRKVTTKASSQLSAYHIRTIVLLPFETMTTPQVMESSGPSFPVPSGARRSDMSNAVPPTTDQYARRTQRVPPAAGEKITDLMRSRLKARGGLRVLSPKEGKAAGKELLGGDGSEAVQPQIFAQRLGADAALIGKVLVYQERVGSRLGADPPAVVGFEVKLVAPNGTLLWEGNYYEKQRPMTEDFVGFIRRYGMFVTAEELATYGAAELAAAVPIGSATD